MTLPSPTRPPAPAEPGSPERGRAGALRWEWRGRVPVSALVPTRPVVAVLTLVLLAAVVTGLALSLGAVTFAPGDVLRALVGEGSARAELFVVRWRLPRAVAALVFGAMLGVAGALFQTVTRNPLGSPDILGFTAGTSLASVATIVLVGSSFYPVAGGALVGGVVVAALVLGLSRGGGASGFRLVIVGIALNAILLSIEGWLVLVADVEVAQAASLWRAGTLNGADFRFTTAPMVLGAVVTVVTVVLLGRRLDLLTMGDDAATALGGVPARTRVQASVAGVALVALVTAAAGPIAFVALAAPHVGRRLARVSGAGLVSAGAAGAFLLGAADLIAQHAVPGESYPVGVVTVVGGGLFLMTLLVRENRKGTL